MKQLALLSMILMGTTANIFAVECKDENAGTQAPVNVLPESKETQGTEAKGPAADLIEGSKTEQKSGS